MALVQDRRRLRDWWREIGTIVSTDLAVLRFVPGEKRTDLIVSAALMLVVALTTTTPAIIVGRLVDKFTVSDDITMASALPYLLVVFVLIVIRETAQVARRYFAERAATALEQRLRVESTRAVLRASGDLFVDRQGGALYGRMGRGVEGATKLTKLTFLDFFPSVILAFVSIGLVYSQSVLVGICVSGVMPVFGAIVAWQLLSQRGVRVALLRDKEVVDGAVVELLRDLDSVKAMDAVDGQVRAVGVISSRLRSTELQHHASMALFDSVKFGLEGMTHLAVTSVAVWLAVRGDLSVGSILTVSLLFVGAMAPIRELHRIFDEGHESAIQANDLLDILASPEDPSWRRTAQLQSAVGSDGIDIVGMRVAYPSSPNLAIEDVSFAIGPTEFVGLCGPAGCGKSTLAKALMRLIPLEGGQVTLWGQPLDSYDRARLANDIAYVPQSSFLVTGSVYDNIVFGLENVELKRVEDAARRAQIHDEILAMHAGYATLVGEAGLRLSGGQRQRIALARVFLRSPRLVILDEATASLDTLNEARAQQELERSGFAMLAVAHRLSTLRNASKILVMDKGRIVEIGDFDTLVAAGGLFADLHAAAGQRRVGRT